MGKGQPGKQTHQPILGSRDPGSFDASGSNGRNRQLLRRKNEQILEIPRFEKKPRQKAGFFSKLSNRHDLGFFSKISPNSFFF
jgi:hypothetical protein